TQQMMRLDVESREAVPAGEMARLTERAVALVGEADAVVLSDYAKGALSKELCGAVIAAARAAGRPVLADPKTRDFAKYAGATAVCPNLGELATATGVESFRTEGLLAAGRELVRAAGLEYLVVTMSEKGITVLRGAGEKDFYSPARAREVFDVSGAGDTVIATLAAGLAGGLGIETAVELANVAAGIVVAKVGTVPIAHHELITELTPSAGYSTAEKVLGREQLHVRVQNWRESGETIVFTNGCFDILHVGHISLLEECRRFGTKLVLGLNADESISRLKGPERPIVKERERARVMAALGAVDAVVLFGEDTPLELIRAIGPDVLVKGGDYTVATVVGAEDVIAAGGRVEIVPTVQGFSTTNIVKRMKG
ncbi:MAG: D-glycero-beta-D-manno-heptose 1-phosphate adenylyltransferase, partial [Acidobacteriota bacterium]|nr:D-glycero-beta-D-manno-heptose 1-phosphate adenylyltransferase [Acidobacteriota bacterium]